MGIDNWLLKKQQIELTSNAGRILHCMQEFFSHIKNADGLINAIKLNKALNQFLWPESQFVMHQISPHAISELLKHPVLLIL